MITEKEAIDLLSKRLDRIIPDSYSLLSFDELLKLIFVCDKIYTMRVDNNCYGQFLFYRILIDGFQINGYGLGLHEYRQHVYMNFVFSINENTGLYGNDSPTIDKLKAIDIMKNRRDYAETIEAFPDEKSERYTMVAELTDDDYAMMHSF